MYVAGARAALHAYLETSSGLEALMSHLEQHVRGIVAALLVVQCNAMLFESRHDPVDQVERQCSIL